MLRGAGRACAAFLLLAVPSGAALGQGEMLGGMLAMDPATSCRWCWSGSFRFPVGDPLALGSASGGVPAFRVNRNVSDGHRGADLDNRRRGDVVCACAHGLVIDARADGWNGGYGATVVIAHRLDDGSIAYSVYAHLAPGSVAVRGGEAVRAGQRLGRIGRTGRATTDHLHFEIRIPDRLDERWENVRVVDPVAFVTARLPTPANRAGWAAPYVGWAEDAGLVRSGPGDDAPLERSAWWRMLARGACHGLSYVPDDPPAIRAALIGVGLLTEDEPADPEGHPRWAEIAAALERVRTAGLRVAPPEVGADTLRSDRERELAPLARSRPGARGGPNLAQACLALAGAAAEARSTALEAPGR